MGRLGGFEAQAVHWSFGQGTKLNLYEVVLQNEQAGDHLFLYMEIRTGIDLAK